MGRIVVAEEKLLPDLVRVGKTDGYVPGLIIGQTSGQKDFIVHLARTPLPAETIGQEIKQVQKKSVENLIDIQESWIVDHAKQVTRMLPGGMWVLGLFVTGPGDIFAEPVAHSKISFLIKCLVNALDQNPILFGNSPTTEKLVLQLFSRSNKYVCKSLDISNSPLQFRSTDCKFLGNLKWHKLDTQFDFDSNPPHLIYRPLNKQPLKSHLEKIIDVVSVGIQKSLYTIDGEVRDNEDLLDVNDSKVTKGFKKQENDKIFQVSLYIPCATEDSDLSVSPVMGEMKCIGVLASRVFVHQAATVDEALKAVKEDIIRSFASRLDMHCDSLLEEEDDSPDEEMVVHEPPRRILIPLPSSQAVFSDYLFPGEGPAEALGSIMDLLGIQITESAVIKDFEGQPDLSELYNLTTGSDTSKHEESCSPASNHSLYLVFASIACLIAIVSLLIQFYFY